MNDTSRPHPSPATLAASGRGKRPERINGAQAVVRSLEELGTDVVFGLPGGAVLPLYEALYGSEKLNHILVRHEQGAGHAATVGRFDDEHMFYLKSRGISDEEARRLIIRGFFTDVIRRVPVDSVRENLEDVVEQELVNTVL